MDKASSDHATCGPTPRSAMAKARVGAESSRRCCRNRASAPAGRSGRGDQSRTNGWHGRARHRRPSPGLDTCPWPTLFWSDGSPARRRASPLGQALQWRQDTAQVGIAFVVNPLEICRHRINHDQPAVPEPGGGGRDCAMSARRLGSASWPFAGVTDSRMCTFARSAPAAVRRGTIVRRVVLATSQNGAPRPVRKFAQG